MTRTCQITVFLLTASFSVLAGAGEPTVTETREGGSPVIHIKASDGTEKVCRIDLSLHHSPATEMAEASLKVAFEQLGFPEIASWTLPTNTASRRIMEKPRFRDGGHGLHHRQWARADEPRRQTAVTGCLVRSACANRLTGFLAATTIPRVAWHSMERL